MSVFLWAFCLSTGLSLILTPLVRALALRWRLVDVPGSAPDRKIHEQPTPLGGGAAAMIAFFLTLGIVRWFQPSLLAGIPAVSFLGLALASIIVLIGGTLDDRFRLSPGQQLLFPVGAALVVLSAGVSIEYITNPFGGLLRLDQTRLALFSVAGQPLVLTLWASLFSFVWILGMSYTTKFLDGLDGLVAGVTVIGGVITFLVSLRPEVQQPTTALLSIILAGALLGFLPMNFHPARMFLGEAGSLWTGFMLGVLAIIAGGKIATALLLMGIPILDVAWVILRRLRERRSPFRSADRKHLHFRLLDLGFSHRGAVLFLYALTALFGVSTLFVHGRQKVFVLGLLVFVMIALGTLLVVRARRNA